MPMRSVAGSVPVLMLGTGRRTDFASDAYQVLREAIWELAEENAHIHRGPERFHQPLADDVHLTDAGYEAQALLDMRKMLKVLGENVTGGVDGPAMTGA